MSLLQVRDAMPHFEVARLDGARVRYESIWQRKNLLLVVMPTRVDNASETYASQLANRLDEITRHDAECVITRDPIPGIQPPGVLVADRWGEVHFVAESENVAGLPPLDELIEWLQYVQMKCPECEGESR